MLKKIQYKYMVSFIYVLILFLDRLDLTLINVAMPTFAKDFHIHVTQTDWIATSFLIALGVSMPVSGWLSEKFGCKKIFILANLIFTFASVFCAFAWSLNSLIFFRVLQGIGGGLLVPVGMSMTYQSFAPKEYSKVANYTLIPTLIAPSIAPALGGFILEKLNWHWIFLFHFPIGFISIILSLLYLKNDEPKASSSVLKFDMVGFILLSFGLSSLFYFLSQVGLYGFSYLPCKISGCLFLILILIFIIWELRIANPLVHLNFFKIPLFFHSIILQVSLQICYFGSLFLIAIYFQECLGMNPIQSGLAMTGQSLGTICMLFFSGKILQRIGPKYLFFVGFLCLSILTSLVLCIKSPNEILFANIILWCRGLSIGLVNGPLQACAMLDLKKHQTSKGSALFNILRQIGISLGVALSCLLLAMQGRDLILSRTASQSFYLHSFSEFYLVFHVFSFVALFGAFFSLILDNKKIHEKLNLSHSEN